MIRSDQIQPVIEQRLPQRFPVVRGLDGGIAFDPVAQFRIVVTGEMQMMHAYFGGDPFFFQGQEVAEQLHFLFRGQVEDMQTAAMTLGELNGGKARIRNRLPRPGSTDDRRSF